MLRVCLYARFSTDKQNEASVDDQFRICRVRIEHQNWLEVASYYDMAISGSTKVDDRPGGRSILAEGMAGNYDVLMLEGLDRLSRDQVEQERIVRRLEYRGIRIVGVADGYDSTLSARKVLRGVRGLINEIYLDDLRHKTHRGQAGQIERGYISGGKSYGYDIIKTEGGSRYTINEEQANWVRYIFKEYAEGLSVQKIAHQLNKLNVASPRNTTWAVSAIYGSPVKGSGILNNRLYIGEMVWNRSQWLKNPDTGKRQRIERPKEEWKIIPVPELRIIEKEIWDRVRKRIDSGRDKNGRKRYGRRGVSLFGGYLSCPNCSGKLIAVNAVSYGCQRSKDRGKTVCPGFLVNRKIVEKKLLNILRKELLTDKAALQFERHFKNEVESLLSNKESDTKQQQDRLVEIEGSIEKIIDAISTVGVSDSLAEKLRTLELEKKALTSTLNQKPLIEIKIPNIKKAFHDTVDKLDESIGKEPEKAREILQDIFGTIQIEQRGKEVWAKINTAQSLSFAIEPYLKVVAEAGFEPTTFGL